jgi:hypothetical protein
LLNRSAVVVRPKQPFVAWLKSIEELHLPDVTQAQLGTTLYLVPAWDDPADAEKVLGRVHDEIFCRELESWSTDEATWPKRRSLKLFKQWFDVVHFDLVQDVGPGPIGNDEGPEERHRFGPPRPPPRPPRRPPPKGKPRR